MDKTIIYTTFFVKNPSYEILIWEWLISLRTLGKYKGKIIIFDYGMTDDLIYRLNNFELGAPEIIRLRPQLKADGRTIDNGLISNYRNIDVIPHLEKYKDYMFAHFDADIWFQRDISPLWEDCKNSIGVVHGVERGRVCRYRGPKNELAYNDTKQRTLGGFIFGGFIAGRYEPYLNKLNEMKLLYETTWKPTIEWGTDQSMITHIANLKNDNLDGIRYGASVYFCEFENKRIILDKIEDKYRYEECIGIHVLSFSNVGSENEINIDKYRFKTRYPELMEYKL